MPTRSTPVAGGLLAALLILSARPVLAATTVPPGNITTQTWTPDGNPYVVTGDITIPAAAILTIQAGTAVLFTATDASAGGLSASQVELTVAGQLRVQGSWSSPVTFEAQSGSSPGTWYGIVVEATGVASIDGAVIAETQVGIASSALSASGALLAVRDTLVQNSVVGISAADALITEARVSGMAGVGISISGSGTIENAIVDHCATGISNENASGSAALTIQNCTIDSNTGAGVLLSGPAGFTVYLVNDLVTNNGQYGIEGGGTTSASSTYSDVWNNGAGNYLDVTAGTGSLSANPLYESATDYHLQAGSPAINAGTSVGSPSIDFDLYPRPQGGLWDIGAYEYAGGTDAGTSTGGAAGGSSGAGGSGGQAGNGGMAGSGAAGAGVAGTGGAGDSSGAAGGAGASGTGGGAGESGGGAAGGMGGAAGAGTADQGGGGVAGAPGRDAGADGHPSGGASSGCGCRTSGAGAGPLSLALGLAALVAARRRRRR